MHAPRAGASRYAVPDVDRCSHFRRKMRMTASPRAGGRRNPRRPRSRSSSCNGPKPDMGPAWKDRGFLDSSSGGSTPLPSPSREEFVIEAIEIAGIRAEQAVIPFRRDRMETPQRGASMVEVVFFDQATLRSFLRVRAVRPSTALATWLLIRRWSRTDNDADLDEAMCGIVAGSINADFPSLLRASVITLLY